MYICTTSPFNYLVLLSVWLKGYPACRSAATTSRIAAYLEHPAWPVVIWKNGLVNKTECLGIIMYRYEWRQTSRRDRMVVQNKVEHFIFIWQRFLCCKSSFAVRCTDRREMRVACEIYLGWFAGLIVLIVNHFAGNSNVPLPMHCWVVNDMTLISYWRYWLEVLGFICVTSFSSVHKQ